MGLLAAQSTKYILCHVTRHSMGLLKLSGNFSIGTIVKDYSLVSVATGPKFNPNNSKIAVIIFEEKENWQPNLCQISKKTRMKRCRTIRMIWLSNLENS
jgi:hypothetical protein